MWKRGIQEVGISRRKKKEKREDGATTRSMEEGKRTQWSKGAAPKGSGNVHERVDNTQGSSNLCGV